MKKQSLNQKLKSRNVYEVLKNIDYNLQMAHGNGASVHSLDSIRCPYVLKLSKYEDKMSPIEETFDDFKKRDREDYDSSIKLINDTILKFKIAA